MSDPRPRHDPRGLERVRAVFEELGRTDPLYAALARKSRRGNAWDPKNFFESGAQEISEVLGYVDALGLRVGRARALDFGCAVGRLTQGLANHFERVVGVDISSAMVEKAVEANRHGDRVSYVLNTAPDLRVLESDSFDFVYSNKVLQHIPPEFQEEYIGEFVRLLRPGGIATFQTRNGPVVRPGTLRGWIYTMNRIHLRRLFQRLRSKPGYEMHHVARSRVEAVVAAAGGRVVDVVDLSQTIPELSLRYCVQK